MCPCGSVSPLAKKYRNNEITINELQNALVKTYDILDGMLEEMQSD